MPTNRNFAITTGSIATILVGALLIKQWRNRIPTPTFPSSDTPFRPLTDYQITLHPNIPLHLQPWTTQVLEQAKQNIVLGQNCNQLWTHGGLRVRLVLSDQPLTITHGNIQMNIGNGALAVDGGRCFTLNQIVQTIKEIAAHYGQRIQYTSNNGLTNGISGVDLLAQFSS
jgi:hypothetical protein